MNESRVAYPYAKSLYLLTQELGNTEELVKDMELVSAVCKENPALAQLFKSPIVPHDKKKSIMDTIFKGRVSSLTFDIYALLKKKNREAYFAEIAKQFVLIYKAANNIISAQITSASPLTDKLREDFKLLIAKKFNSEKVEVEELINPEIVGGYILKVGDRQIDHSIIGKIATLKNKFKDNPYISQL